MKQQLIDEYGELSRKVAAFKPIEERHKALKQQIAGWYDDKPAEQCEEEGRVYRVYVYPRAKEHRITSMRKVYRFLGVTRFLEHCTFPLKALNAVVDDPAKYVEETQTGPRKVVVIPIHPAAESAAASEKLIHAELPKAA